MIPKGQLSCVQEYYYKNPIFKDEILRAFREFFEVYDLGQGKSLETTQQGEGLFNEWLIYDFHLKNGNTILADFIVRNPLALNKKKLDFYKKLLGDNNYGIFKVLSVDLGIGLQLQNVQTGRQVNVFEFSATFQIKKGIYFFGRIGLVNDHYELVGADTLMFQTTDSELAKYLKTIAFSIGPKFVNQLYLAQAKS